MTKAERIMASLRADNERKEPPKPDRGVRQRLALALMRADRQISCTNCTWRYRPCSKHEECKADKKFVYFSPKPSLLEIQMNRVDHIMDEIKEI